MDHREYCMNEYANTLPLTVAVGVGLGGAAVPLTVVALITGVPMSKVQRVCTHPRRIWFV